MSEYGGQLVDKAKILEILARLTADLDHLPDDAQFLLVEAGTLLTFNQEIRHVALDKRPVIDAPVSSTWTFRMEFSHHDAGA